MKGYKVIKLKELLEELGADKTQEFILGYKCPLNEDVERFLKERAVEFAKQSLAGIYFVFTAFQGKLVLIGYFALSNKNITIRKNSSSNSFWKRAKKFGTYDEVYQVVQMPVLLIGQIGKNFANELNGLISGDELLELALSEVRNVHSSIGGRFVYLECEDNEKLTVFYHNHGFIDFGKRYLEKDEKNEATSDYLLQMIKYLH